MSDVAHGMVQSFQSPQFIGELFTADSIRTPLLSMTGGLTGGLRTDNEQFPTAVIFGYPEARQPEISEYDAAWNPTTTFLTRDQETNVVQIFQETVGITYQRLSNTGRIDGVTSRVTDSLLENELDFQIAHKLKIMARDIEFSFINGEYHRRESSHEASKTRGLISVAKSASAVNASGEPLTRETLSNLFKQMADNGAYFDDMVIFVNSSQKTAISEAYSNQPGFMLPQSRNRAGINVLEIDNDFFRCGVVYNKFVPQDTILVADIAHVAPVFQTVPGKGHIFLEELSKTGAAEMYHLYAQVGLAHGPGFLHGIIEGLKV